MQRTTVNKTIPVRHMVGYAGSLKATLERLLSLPHLSNIYGI